MTLAPVARRTVIGPTWTRSDDGLFVMPAASIGFQVIDWCEEWLLQPDGPDAGQPWRFTKEQKRFLLWWYAVDERGRFIYRAGMLRRLKGWGKDPLAVCICAAECLGPCRFAGWANGEAQAEPHYAACVQIAAVSQDQVKRNTMSLFPAMFSSAAIREYELDIGKEIIYAFRGRCRIEMLTSSSRAAEGPRPTAIIKNESQHWVPSNGGPEMAAVCARNAAKSRDGSTRTLAISNAHAPGELSDAELDYEGYELNPAGFMYDSLEAQQETVDALVRLKTDHSLPEEEKAVLRAEIMRGLPRGDSSWLDGERLTAECEDPRTRLNDALRFYMNKLAAGEDKAFNHVRWGELERNGYKVAPGSQIALGFDGSVTRDWTALIATELSTGFQWPVGIWVPSTLRGGEYRVDDEAVDQTMTSVFETYKVWRLYADPFWWREWISAWAGRFGKERVVEWPTNQYRRMAYALADFATAIEAGDLTHDGNQQFAAAIANAHKMITTIRDDDGELMWVIQKERPDSPNKIDPAVAAALSWRARADAIANGVLNVNDWHGIDLGDDEDA